MGYAADFLTALKRNIEAVIAQEWPNIVAAVDWIARALVEGHTTYEYLAGHLMPKEAAIGRRGRPDIFQPLNESTIDVLRTGDVVLMTHQYGVLEKYVEIAIKVKERGAKIIAVASRSDPAKIIRTHPTGTSVGFHADVMIDTHIPEGDVAIDAPSGSPGSCPTSAVIQALIHWVLVAGIAESLGAQ
ncbi:MAG: hypothetical protein ACUVX8_11820 [Candidatus Zipacnadales bacterium]